LVTFIFSEKFLAEKLWQETQNMETPTLTEEQKSSIVLFESIGLDTFNATNTVKNEKLCSTLKAFIVAVKEFSQSKVLKEY
jgi:hypothetical protein